VGLKFGRANIANMKGKMVVTPIPSACGGATGQAGGASEVNVYGK